jgi:antitoxin YefM
MCYVLYNNVWEVFLMNALTYTSTRQHFAEVMRQVNDDHEPVIVTSQRGKPVVIISLDDYQSLEETAYLLRNPTGAKRLLESVEELRIGGGVVKELPDDD